MVTSGPQISKDGIIVGEHLQIDNFNLSLDYVHSIYIQTYIYDSTR